MIDLITQHMDVWTSAQLTKSTAGRGNSGKQTAYGIKKLRELILELAVRGKLVPQDPNDEPVSVLLEKIAEERRKLFESGKIKSIKHLAKLSNSEMTFELPHGWEWAFIPEVVINDKYAIKRGPFGSAIKKDYFVSSGYKVYEQQHAIYDNFSLGEYYITEEKFNDLKAFEVKPNDLIISCSGTVGKVAIAPSWMESGIINQALLKLTLNEDALTNKYFKLLFPAFYMKTETLSDLQGTAQKNMVSVETLKVEPFPLPPLAEQHRIVAKVDELMALCDQLEQQQTDNHAAHQTLVETLLGALIAEDGATANNAEAMSGYPSQDGFAAAWQHIAEHFDTLFTTEHSIDQLKQTILQLAVMGKLVPQDPNDEPASVLLEKIAEEKARLVKEGKIKKQNPLLAINDDEIPFGLPSYWEASRLGTFTVVGTGSTPSRDKAAYYFPQEINWVTSGETSKDFIFETNEKISSLAVQESNVSIYPKGSLIVAMYGQGKTRGQVSELMIEAGTNQACAAIVLVNREVAHRKFLKLFFKKAYEELRSHSAGGAQPNLNLGKISNTVIPIPPLAEQHRIVAKVDELMALCDTLKARIKIAQTTQIQLADVIVEQAVA